MYRYIYIYIFAHIYIYLQYIYIYAEGIGSAPLREVLPPLSCARYLSGVFHASPAG